MNKKIVDVIGTILLIIGFFLAFLPHAFHQKVGFTESSHIKHVVYGIIIVAAALGILVYNNDALRSFGKRQ